MSDGELGSVFKGLASASDQAGGNMAESLAKLSEDTAEREETSLANTAQTEATNARSFTDIAGEGRPAEDAAPASANGSSSTTTSSATTGSDAPGTETTGPDTPVSETTGAGTTGSGTTGADTTGSGTPDDSISGRLSPDSAEPSDAPVEDYRPSAAEQALQARKIVDSTPIDPGGHANPAYRVTFDDGTSGIYKPAAGEDASLRQGIPGGLTDREVASSRVDEAFGFGRVPTTAKVDGPAGPGSIQQWREGDSALSHDAYPRVQQEQMAVLDYVTGNTDRHLGNYLTDPDGNVIAIDHGYSFPESPDPRFGIRSDFVAQNMNVPLSDEVMNSVRAVDPGQMRSMLQGMGLGGPATDGALARLREVQTNGMITGAAWPGVINGAFVP